MAVNTNSNQTGQSPNQKPQDDLSGIGRGRINDLFGSSLDIGEDGSAILDAVYTSFKAVCSKVNDTQIRPSVHKMLSSEQSPDSRLAFPTVLLIVRVKDKCIVMPYFIVPGRLADFDNLTVRDGSESIILPRHPSEAFDSRALSDFKTLANKVYGIDINNIFAQEAKCMHDVDVYMSGSEEDQRKRSIELLGPAIRIAAGQLIINRLGYPDVSLANLETENNSHISITYRNLDSLRTDEDGIPIGGNMMAVVRVEGRTGDNSNSINVNRGAYQIGTTCIRASIVHATGPNMLSPAMTPQGMIRPPMFTPQLILDDITVNGDPTPANITLMLASATPLISPEIIRRMYDPKDIGYLNTRANVTGDGKPFAEKDVRAAYPQVWAQFFNNSLVLSMLLRSGSISALFGSMFLRNTLNANGVGETKAAIESLFNVSMPQLSNAVRNPGVEIVPIGTYKLDNNKERPLSDIDLLWLIRNCANRPHLIDQWARSSDGSVPLLTALAMKINVIRVVTNGTANVVDRGVVITFSPEYVQAINYCMRQSNVGINTNLATMTGIEQGRWNPYLTVTNSAIDMNNFVPFTGTVAQSGGSAYTYGMPGSGYYQ